VISGTEIGALEIGALKRCSALVSCTNADQIADAVDQNQYSNHHFFIARVVLTYLFKPTIVLGQSTKWTWP